MSDPADHQSGESAERAPAALPLPVAEAEAWADVVAHWEDEGAHRAYLARFNDLDGMANAGRRYRAVLADRPADAMAARMREVVLKKATALGLAALPRTTAREESPRTRKVKLGLYFALGCSLLYLAALVFRQFAQLLGSRP